MKSWYTAESMEKPKEYDLTSSPTTVYKRKNIQQKTRKADQEGEADTVFFEYQERQLTHEEYEAIQAELESPATKLIMQQLSAIELRQEMLEEMMEG